MNYLRGMKNRFFKIITLSFLLFLASPNMEINAQCPMCKIGAESNLKNGGAAGKGLNTGILFMLSMPYLIVGSIGYMWWRNRNKGEVIDDDLYE